MSTREVIDATTALEKFFEIVREEAAVNPQFGKRLIEAVGYKVIYRGDEAKSIVDPVLVAMEGQDEFRRTFLSMKQKDVEKIGLDAGLIQKPPKGTKAPRLTLQQLVDLLWDRSKERIEDLVPRPRHAAE